MDLAGALELTDHELVSFVGAGGKKTAMGRLVEEGTAHLSVGYTTTTHMPPPAGLDLHLGRPEGRGTEQREREREQEGEQGQNGSEPPEPLAFASERVEDPARVDEKVKGFEPGIVDTIYESGRFDWLLVKADGARMREFKAPDVDEPAIPRHSTVVVPVVSAKAIGTVLTAETVHRPERVAAITSMSIGDVIEPSTVGAVLASEEGGLKRVPEGARVIPMLNKADAEGARKRSREALRTAFERSDRFETGLITSFEREYLEVVPADG